MRGGLHPVQAALANSHGSQVRCCSFASPLPPPSAAAAAACLLPLLPMLSHAALCLSLFLAARRSLPRQCGFCTPGFVMSMYSLLREKAAGGAGAPDEEEIEDALAGNLW